MCFDYVHPPTADFQLYILPDNNKTIICFHDYVSQKFRQGLIAWATLLHPDISWSHSTVC